jgi:hypothetical protein
MFRVRCETWDSATPHPCGDFVGTQEEQDRWLLENREEINSKIRRGIAQLDRGEGIPEDQLDTYLAKLKAQSE